MSRVLKFRVWKKSIKKYVDLTTFTITNDGEITAVANSNTLEPALNKDDYILEQYTGLKDKNGIEIYEGDIVRTTDRVTAKGLIFPIGVVEFKQRAFWICNVPSERPDFAHNETLLQYWETDLEVIGNIHENPELFGGEDETN